jgi:uncharacterized membrane protein
MNSALIIPSVIFVCTGLLLIGLAVPLIRRRIPPNHLYGFRMPDAFSSDAVWYDVNEYSARQLRSLGLLVIAAVPILLVLDLNELYFGIVMTAILLIGVIVMVIRSLLHLQQLMKR